MTKISYLKTWLALTLICQYTEQVNRLPYFGVVFCVCLTSKVSSKTCLLSKVT